MNIKIKRLLSLTLALFLLAGCFSISSAAADAKAVLEFRVSDDGYAVVTECDTAAKGVLSVPDKATVNGKTYYVKYIGDRAFDKCKKLTEIKLPEGVTAIGSAAFRNCTGLREVFIPESLVRCELDAFDGCSDVTVHCYTSNYQFITLCGTYSDITVDIIDVDNIPQEDNSDSDEDNLEDLGFIGRFISALKTLIKSIMNYFGADDDDFSIEDLPFDLPFDIPVEEDNGIFDIDL